MTSQEENKENWILRLKENMTYGEIFFKKYIHLKNFLGRKYEIYFLLGAESEGITVELQLIMNFLMSRNVPETSLLLTKLMPPSQ